MTKRPSQPIHFKDQDQKDRFAQAAIAAGFETGRGPGITAWLKMLGEREIAAGQVAERRVLSDGTWKEAKTANGEDCLEFVPETVTWESMTADEQWWGLYWVHLEADTHDPISLMSFKLWNEAALPDAKQDKWMGPSSPGYQARYSAALAYVKGVMDD